MKKIMYERNKDTKSLKGFVEEIVWNAISYYGGPKEEGKYLVSDGNGKVKTLYCTGRSKTGKELFDMVMNGDYENVYFHGNGDEPLTNDELIDLYKQYNVWYDTNEYYDYDMSYIDLIIYRGDDIPKYFIETKTKGPIDSELDDYDEIIEQ